MLTGSCPQAGSPAGSLAGSLARRVNRNRQKRRKDGSRSLEGGEGTAQTGNGRGTVPPEEGAAWRPKPRRKPRPRGKGGSRSGAEDQMSPLGGRNQTFKAPCIKQKKAKRNKEEEAEAPVITGEAREKEEGTSQQRTIPLHENGSPAEEAGSEVDAGSEDPTVEKSGRRRGSTARSRIRPKPDGREGDNSLRPEEGACSFPSPRF